MGEPTSRVPVDCRPIKSLGIGIHSALTPAQDGQHGQQRHAACLAKHPPPTLGTLEQQGHAGREERHDPQARQVLVMVGDERVAERVQVEETQHREEGPAKKQEGRQGARAMRRAAHVTPNKAAPPSGNKVHPTKAYLV